MDTQCEQCHAHSTLKCSKCNANYCSVACQHAAWPTHKAKCSRRALSSAPSNLPYRASTNFAFEPGVTDTDRVLRKIIGNVRQRIEGNLQLILAHNPNTSSLRVTISERVESMVSDFHWAHIACVGDGPMPHVVLANFALVDVHLTEKIVVDTNCVLANTLNPGREWYVMFEM